MGRKKKAEEKSDSAGAVIQQPFSSGKSSRSSPPGIDGSAAIGEEKRLSESAEKRKKQSWLKRIFSRGSKTKDGVRRSVSASEALGSPTKSDEDSVFSGDSRETSPLSALNEDSDEEIGAGHDGRRSVTKQTSSPAVLGFRKRPITVEVGDDVWAQVKAKQDAMFHDSNLLKVDPGTSSSAKTPPFARRQVDGNEDATLARAGVSKLLDVSDDEWARVRAAQEKMFDNTADAMVPDEKQSTQSKDKPKNTNGTLTALVEEARQKRPSSEVISSADQVKAALAKKEELPTLKMDMQSEKRTLEKSLSVGSDDPIDVDIDTHEFFADIENHEFFADVVKQDFSADSPDKVDKPASPTLDTSEPNQSTPEAASSIDTTDKKQPTLRNTLKVDDGASQVALRDLVRQQSMKLRKDRETKRHTVASPEFLDGEKELWESVQSKHQSVLGDLGTQPIPDRLDGLEMDVRESSPDDSMVDSGGLSAIRVKKSGVVVGMKPSEAQRPSILPDWQGEKSGDGEIEIRIDSGYLSADLSVVPTIQPSLGLSAGHMRRNLSRKNKRRPPSIRVAIPENQDLFEMGETRAGSSSTGNADEDTKAQAAKAADTRTKGLQRAKTVADPGRKSSGGTGTITEVLDEQKSPDSTAKQPAWLHELEQKRKGKQGTSATTHPLYKTRSPTSPTREVSTALLVAEAAKRKSQIDSLVSFKQPTTAPIPRPRSMFVTTSGGPKEPSWVGKAQKKSSAGKAISPVQSPNGSVANSAPEWIAKAQKMSKQQEQQVPTSPAAATDKLKPVKQGSIQDRINSLRRASSPPAT